MVAWLSHNWFQDKNYWLVQDSQHFSTTIRGMLQLKPLLSQFLRCNVGDGKRASFWYDFWIDLGPLFLMFGSSGSRQLQVPLSASVSDAVVNGDWFFPPAPSEDAVTLQIVMSTTRVPTPSSGPDVYLWRGQTGGFVSDFSSHVKWNRLRTTAPMVPWYEVVWFKEDIPRCSFVTWLAMLARLPTRDRLLSWGLKVPGSCVLCADGIESHDHLFFNCPFAVGIWSKHCGRFIISSPINLHAVVLWCSQYQGLYSVQTKVIFKLLLQVIVCSL